MRRGVAEKNNTNGDECGILGKCQRPKLGVRLRLGHLMASRSWRGSTADMSETTAEPEHMDWPSDREARQQTMHNTDDQKWLVATQCTTEL